MYIPLLTWLIRTGVLSKLLEKTKPLRRSTTMLQEQRGGNTRSFADSVRAALTSAAIGLALAGPMVSLPGGAAAAGKRMVGEISASGLIFKVSAEVCPLTASGIVQPTRW